MTDSLLSPDALRDDAIDRVEAATDLDWWTAATTVTRQLSQSHKFFTTDDVWFALRELQVHTPEPRAMGAVIRFARSHGWILPTGVWVRSRRPACHSRPISRWRSLLYDETT